MLQRSSDFLPLGMCVTTGSPVLNLPTNRPGDQVERSRSIGTNGRSSSSGRWSCRLGTPHQRSFVRRAIPVARPDVLRLGHHQDFAQSGALCGEESGPVAALKAGDHCGNQARIGRLTAQTGQQFDSPDERFALAALENFLGGAIDRVHRVADGAVVFEAPLDYQPPEFSFLNYKHSSFQVIHGCTLYECKATLLWYSHRPLRCTDGSGTQISCTQGRALGKMGRRVTGACDPSHKSL